MEQAFRNAKARLDALRGDVLKRAERKALRAVGELVQARMVELAPEKAEGDGGLLEPGELKADIQVKVSVASDNATAMGRESRVVIGPGEQTREVAHWVEHGHVARRSKTAEGPARYVPAHPFIRSTADSTEQAAHDLYVEIMTAEIKKAK